ncbi:uncharacterized protein ACA1_177580 [Acanthamoeba castellanii str. Neff]|uniref:Uncharacterized protein n=1 Tax=Acanthamoeba castellanii (strain ATCC 30010 / Neff) TaxID=1257118 RepID=L8GSJ3_ACACF|nr:uncharacterized protein ACA1_177580 [Acanthamoeba castellanii str. Neff]ELR16149.1 hypothetical protein ACA1_177580 [Acanthamoeba castellanii str. Neff]
MDKGKAHVAADYEDYVAEEEEVIDLTQEPFRAGDEGQQSHYFEDPSVPPDDEKVMNGSFDADDDFLSSLDVDAMRFYFAALTGEPAQRTGHDYHLGFTSPNQGVSGVEFLEGNSIR